MDIYTAQYGPGIIAGYRNGYFSKEQEPEVAKQISDSGAQAALRGHHLTQEGKLHVRLP